MNVDNNNLPITELDDTGLAVAAGWFTVYNIDPVQREYQQTSSEYLPEGVGLPAFCFADPPPESATGLAIVRSVDGTAWEKLPDYRGQTVYSTNTGQPETVIQIGKLGQGLTPEAPATPFDKWNGKNWITDEEAVSAVAVSAARDELSQRQREAADKIATLEDAVSLGMATDHEVADLKEWKVYRVLLNRVDVTKAPNIDWPAIPA
ncbi:tail fiber assembly protein [Yersinia sp. HM-2024]|uniref:tail fiber assembly protein n=1 Tax=Yersinia sp. HM-2024 TaxID=3344550 RepID=UPI00370D3C49